MRLTQSSYLRGIDSLPPDLTIRGSVTDPLTPHQARRLRREVNKLKQQIRLAREQHEAENGPVYIEPPPEC